MSERLHIRVDSGSGPAVVLLHGFPLDGSIWEETACLLAGKYRVIVPDLRGFGNSAYSPFTIGDLASDVAEQLRGNEIRQAVVAGLSMGGYVALELWSKYPEFVAGLALVNSKAEADGAAAKDGRNIMAELAQSQGSDAVAEKMIGKMLHPTRYSGSDALPAQVMGIMRRCPAQTIASASLAMRDRADFTGELGNIRVPARVIVGEADQLIPLSMARATAQAMPRGRLVIVPGAGHLSSVEAPAAVADALACLSAEAYA